MTGEQIAEMTFSEIKELIELLLDELKARMMKTADYAVVQSM